MKLEKSLKKSLSEKWFMRFKTFHPDGDAYDGIVTHIGDDFFAMRVFSSFEMEGLQILAKWGVRGTRDGKFERCFNEIMTRNGELGKLEMPDWIKECETLRDVFVQVSERDIWPAVETNAMSQASAFYLGPVTKVRKKSFDLYCYDAAGKWEANYRVRFDEVFRVELDSAYTNHFNAYMRSKDDDSAGSNDSSDG